ncbi:winged helix-turn-helix domain-containing protein [Steroidobacter sp. S1-65]|uniref:Winged helix-turn-helix domain-containing protein n=1 Tax=Steroidobacter gossypii TaxID=2805490 RepID=A0ABS1WZH4_9GAMM|nr:winged helix-turn-helix domain-containing protein [Steroidobacter gossypii]MBM0106352.1 winged helix-turn-helix domain-containing protein [Steroidobacter gossypii]
MDVESNSIAASRDQGIKQTRDSSLVSLHAAELLIVDADAGIREALSFLLRRNGWRCREAHDADAARSCIGDGNPGLILLDWLLPDVTGLGYLHQLKRDPKTSGIPVIIMSTRATERDKVAGLDSGADDYVLKPIASAELVSRIQAILRRVKRMGDTRGPLSVGGLTLDPASHRVLADGRTCALGPTEFKLLEYLMSDMGRVHTRQQLRHQVWTSNESVNERTVDVYVRRLRQVLQPFGYDRLVQTVHGSGYRFVDTLEE